LSLRADLVRLDAQIAELTPEQREAMRAACVQIGQALTNLGTAIPDGTTSPIAATVQSVLLDVALCYRPGRGWSGLRPKMFAALEECPTLKTVAGEFVAKLTPPASAVG
jgi:hypothetical protein